MKLSRPLSSFFPGVLLGLLLMFGLNAAWVEALLGTPMRGLEVTHDWFTLKERAMAEKAGQPRLVVLGGSASHYGISARVLEEELGIPSVNLATHAGLAHYVLERAKGELRPGDHVLLVLEYMAYQRGATQATYEYILSRDPAYFRQQDWLDWARFVLSLEWRSLAELSSNARKLPKDHRWDDPIEESRDDINAWGDQTNHLEQTQVDKRLIEALADPPQGIPAQEEIEAFLRWAKQNDIQVLVTWPNALYRDEYLQPATLAWIQRLKDFYTQENQVPVLGDFRASLLPPEQFYDTYYHLLEPTAVERTRRLIPLIRPYLPQAKDPDLQIDTPSLPGE